jgi:hypothetical protein
MSLRLPYDPKGFGFLEESRPNNPDSSRLSWPAADEVQGLEDRKPTPVTAPNNGVFSLAQNASSLLPSLRLNCPSFPIRVAHTWTALAQPISRGDFPASVNRMYWSDGLRAGERPLRIVQERPSPVPVRSECGAYSGATGGRTGQNDAESRHGESLVPEKVGSQLLSLRQCPLPQLSLPGSEGARIPQNRGVFKRSWQSRRRPFDLNQRSLGRYSPRLSTSRFWLSAFVATISMVYRVEDRPKLGGAFARRTQLRPTRMSVLGR